MVDHFSLSVVAFMLLLQGYFYFLRGPCLEAILSSMLIERHRKMSEETFVKMFSVTWIQSISVLYFL